MKEKTNFLTESLIAHRGIHNNLIPENSIKAFKEAIKKKHIIELDVHLLKDGNIVVFHDDNLKGLTDTNKKIKDTTYDEIGSLKLNNTDEHIPLLTDVLKLVDGQVPLLIELKYDNKRGLLEDKVMAILKDYKGLYALQSFSPLSLIYLRKNYPDTIRGLLVAKFKKSHMNILKKIILRNMLLNHWVKPDFISCQYELLTNEKIQKFHQNNLLLTWTIKNNEDFNKYKGLCDNCIVENII